MIDERNIGQSRRIMHLDHIPFLIIHLIRNVGNSRNDVHIKLPIEPFLYDFHM